MCPPSCILNAALYSELIAVDSMNPWMYCEPLHRHLTQITNTANSVLAPPQYKNCPWIQLFWSLCMIMRFLASGNSRAGVFWPQDCIPAFCRWCSSAGFIRLWSPVALGQFAAANCSLPVGNESVPQMKEFKYPLVLFTSEVTVSAVMWMLYRTVVVMSLKAKLFL